MKTSIGIVALAAIALTFQAQAAEREPPVAIYQLFDLMGQYGYSIMDKEEFLKLSEQLKAEEKVFPAAMADAKKAWDEKKGEKGWQPFPSSRIKPRSIKKFGSDFPDRASAEKRLAQAESHAAEKLADKTAATKRNNATPEAIEREEVKARAFTEAVSMVNKLMGDKIGRPIPKFGFSTPEAPNKKM